MADSLGKRSLKARDPEDIPNSKRSYNSEISITGYVKEAAPTHEDLLQANLLPAAREVPLTVEEARKGTVGKLLSMRL